MSIDKRAVLYDIHIEAYNEAGQLPRSYKVFRCWVSKCEGPDFAEANALAIEEMTLENDGWERDLEVMGPSEMA